MESIASHPLQRGLVDALIRRGVITSDRVAQVMRLVDRGQFVQRHESSAYSDCPQSISFGATISAPHMHAYALEWLSTFIRPSAKVLDVGSGSGYLTACFAVMLEGHGKVYGIEHIPELVDFSIQNIIRSFPSFIESGIVSIRTGDGRLGLAEGGLYQAIHVGAASPTIPQTLIDQLSPGGRMVIPVGEQGTSQSIYLVDKDSSGIVKKTRALAVSYVPLTSKELQSKGM